MPRQVRGPPLNPRDSPHVKIGVATLPPHSPRDPQTTSRIMSAVPRAGTKAELALRKALRAEGLKNYRVDVAGLPGRPDICLGRAKLAVFVDGAFWHGHRSKFRFGASGPYWDAKIRGNRLRDRRANHALRQLGWVVVRFWDFEVLEDAVLLAKKVATLHNSRLAQLQCQAVRECVS